MIERLWAGWRTTYVQGFAPEGGHEQGPGESLFTRILASGLPDEDTHIVHRGATTFVILNAYPYSPGHVLVLPYREVADLELLTADEERELWANVRDAVTAIKVAYKPQGLNVGINLGAPAGGSVSQHLHVHVLPRWTGDTNFTVVTANTKVLSEPLEATARRIREAWPSAQ